MSSSRAQERALSEDTSGATPSAGASPTTSAASLSATPSSVPGATTGPAGLDASLSYMTPEEEQKWSGKGVPRPTGTSSALPEGAHKIAEYRVTSLAPSMEKTGGEADRFY